MRTPTVVVLNVSILIIEHAHNLTSHAYVGPGISLTPAPPLGGDHIIWSRVKSYITLCDKPVAMIVKVERPSGKMIGFKNTLLMLI